MRMHVAGPRSRLERLCVAFSDLVEVAEGVTHHCPPVAVWRIPRFFNAIRSSRQRLAIDAVSVIDINVQKRWECRAFVSLRHHDHRIANTHFSRTVRFSMPCRAENRTQEFDCDGHVAHDHPWRDGMEPGWRSRSSRHELSLTRRGRDPFESGCE
jgi:hypothetical protein